MLGDSKETRFTGWAREANVWFDPPHLPPPRTSTTAYDQVDRHGLRLWAESSQGVIQVACYHDPTSDQDMVRVWLHGKDTSPNPFILLYEGPIAGSEALRACAALEERP